MRWVRKYTLVVKTSISSGMVYSLNFLMGSVFFALIIFIFLQLWETVSAKSGAIEGYSVNRLIWYYVVAELVMLTRSDVFQNLNEDIRGGGIAYRLNKPYDYVLYQFSDGMGQVCIRLVVNLPVALITGLLFVGFLEGFRWSYLPGVILSAILGIMLNFFIEAAIGMTAFWTEDNSAFFWIFQKLAFMLGLFLPLEFLPGIIRDVAVYLPFSYIAYAPARLLTAYSYDAFLRIVPVQALYLALFAGLTYFACRKGVGKLNVNGG